MFLKSSGGSASKMFRKGLSTATNISKGLGGASNAISGAIKKGSQVANAIGSVPFVKEAIKASPEAQDALAKARIGVRVGKDIAGVLKKGSDFTNPLSYKPVTTSSGGVNVGNVQSNIQSGLQRAKEIGEAGAGIYHFVK